MPLNTIGSYTVENHNGNSYELVICKEDSYGDGLESFLAKPPDRVCIAISPNTVYENRSRLEALFRWLSSHVNTGLVVDGTFLNRWNYQLRDGFEIYEAEKEAKKDSSLLNERIRTVLSGLKLSKRYMIMAAGSYVHNLEFQKISEKVNLFFETNQYFNDLITNAAKTYLRSSIDGFNSNQTRLAENYLLEEISLFSWLHHDLMFQTEIYHGAENQIIRKIVNNHIPNFPVCMKSRSMISIRINPMIGKEQ